MTTTYDTVQATTAPVDLDAKDNVRMVISAYSREDYDTLIKYLGSAAAAKRFGICGICYRERDLTLEFFVKLRDSVSEILHNLEHMQQRKNPQEERPIKEYLDCQIPEYGTTIQLHRQLEDELDRKRMLGNMLAMRELGMFDCELLGIPFRQQRRQILSR